MGSGVPPLDVREREVWPDGRSCLEPETEDEEPNAANRGRRPLGNSLGFLARPTLEPASAQVRVNGGRSYVPTD